MLQQIQTSGEKPPLFLVHGLRDILPLGRAMADRLGPDQPIHAIKVDRIDGGAQAGDSVAKSTRAGVNAIRGGRPAGPVRLCGVGEAGLLAIDIVRELAKQARRTGPLLLVDPPSLQTGYVPAPFSGQTQVILRASVAASFFHPQMNWCKVLCGRRIVHVVPYEHEELFRSASEHVFSLLQFILAEVPSFEDFVAGPLQAGAPLLLTPSLAPFPEPM